MPVITMGVDIPCDTSWYEGTSVHGSITSLFICACSNETSKAQCEIQASEALQGWEAFNDSKTVNLPVEG